MSDFFNLDWMNSISRFTPGNYTQPSQVGYGAPKYLARPSFPTNGFANINWGQAAGVPGAMQNVGTPTPYANVNNNVDANGVDWGAFTANDIPTYRPPAPTAPLSLNNTNSIASRPAALATSADAFNALGGNQAPVDPSQFNSVFEDQTIASLTDMYTNPGARAEALGVQPQGGSFDGLNWDNISRGIRAFGTLASTYLGFQGLGLAEEQFAFTRDAYEQDYQMRLDAYNTNKANNDKTAASLNA